MDLVGFLAAMHNLKRYEATSSSSSSRGSSSGHSGRSLDSSGSESESGDATLSQGCLDFSRSLTLNQLTSMEVEQTGKGEATRKNGQDPERIKMVLTQGACQCNRKCHRRVSFKILLSVCIAFWSLTKGAQDCLLPACRYINLLFPYFPIPYFPLGINAKKVTPNSSQANFFRIRVHPSTCQPRLWSLQNPCWHQRDEAEDQSDDESTLSSSENSSKGSRGQWQIQGGMWNKPRCWTYLC